MRITCSQLDRIINCNGSYYLSQGETGIKTADADLGTAIHEILSGQKTASTEHERMLSSSMQENLELFLREVFKVNSNDESIELVHKERRIYKEINGDILSGKPDLIFTVNNNLCIIDYKTGYYESIENNWQLRGLAVLVMPQLQLDKIKNVYLTIVTPEGYYYSLKPADEIKDWENRIIETFNNLRNPSKQLSLKYGDYCKFCPANYKCSEFKKSIEKYNANNLPVSAKELSELYKKLKIIYDSFPLIKKRIISALEKNEIPELSEYFILGEPRRLPRLNVQINDLVEKGYLTTNELIEVCDVKITDLVNFLANKNKKSKREVKEQLISDGLIIEQLTQPELKEVKK